MRKGISLMETIIVVAIMIIAVVIISTTFITLWRVFQMNLSSFETKSQSGIALQRISEMIEEANSVLSGYTINGTLYATGEEVIVLKLPSISSGGEIIPTDFDYAAVTISTSTNLIADIEPSVDSARISGQIILSNLAQNLNFRYNNSTSTDITAVEIFLKTNKSVYNLNETSTLSTVVQLKNK